MVGDNRGDREQVCEENAGVYMAGSMAGGALATGEEAEAEDSSRREGGLRAADPPTPTTRVTSAPPGQVVIGGNFTGGAMATGKRSRAVDRSVRVDDTAEYRGLLEGLARVRRELAERERTFEVDAVDGELEKAEKEIASTGRIGRTLLERLVRMFSAGGSMVLRGVEGTEPLWEMLSGFLKASSGAAEEPRLDG
ncbi:hypothetical protein [Nocardiopsis sp. ATB16-24]|uniref:hypothetical protein n=1 Tax=Nocardiopsis sp. ATB16-24 TaxID=3019555 RepID=UPI0025527A64|nr:hypothetical protein [Nocardiopsis sp. ATB16-24]